MNQERAKKIAKLLLKIKAVTLNVEKPYRYTSGILSPIYCDNRLIMSYPEKRKEVVQAFLDMIKEENLEFDVVAGVATAGITHAAFIAEKLDLPMAYIRSSKKEHGKENKIEGKIDDDQKALIVEDLVSTGGSSVDAATAVKKVTDCIAVFTYEMEKAKQKFADANINLYTLSNFSTLMEVAVEENYITNEQKNIALEWNNDPQGWGKKMGFEN
ncbi:MAG: orotate phosphoribosyltransferase [Patescibacteria group bacterium]